MNPPTRSTFPLSLDLLYELLEVERDLAPRHLLRRARQEGAVVSTLVLSLAEREGVALGEGSRGELARMTRRSDLYQELDAAVRAVPGARTVKGPSLARYYPAGLLRAIGDLDVVVPDEATLWRVLGEVLDRREAGEALMTELCEGGRRDLLVSVWWLGEDPMLDLDRGVEVTTFAYGGLPEQAVPLRPELPAEQVYADVLAVAEERFQRDFTLKDVLDLVCVLTSPAAPVPAALARAAADYALAPELEELCGKAIGHPALASAIPAELLDGLREPARLERARRDALGPAAQEPRRYGFQLTEPLRRGTGDAVEDHDFGGVLLRRTPVADFLLVTGELVDPADHEAAVAALSALAPWPKRPAPATAPAPAPSPQAPRDTAPEVMQDASYDAAHAAAKGAAAGRSLRAGSGS
ncbi:hypothetical protein AQI88_26385 [Streptomyces cellostaticus]|uniref:Uncharacterized protein n=1 Tax=Streptomyces cellostaticus TaxID=67285 RepID=A0A101NHP6_9ACTN|nr:hypothetical protein [Streptomyces cellostaticus]KUM93508.1 hypothetical protein AQI88_26385 [Streptomyces cellostaticus]GHI10160.1 hypothetical protein Scel_84810 [Streptomyces cellostaticus]